MNESWTTQNNKTSALDFKHTSETYNTWRHVYLSFCMLPWSVDEIHWENLHPQTPLDPIHHNLKPLTIPDQEARVV